MSNRITRIIVALLAIPFLLGLSYWGGIPFLIFILVVGLVSFYEFSTMVRNKNIFPNNLIGFISVALIILNAYFHIFSVEVFLLSLLPLLLIIELFRNKESAINNISSTLLGIFYTGLFSASIIGIKIEFDR